MRTVEIAVPEGMDLDELRAYLNQVAASEAATARIAALMRQQEVGTGPGTAAQLAAIENLWRHLIGHYGVYTSSDIATMRGANPRNRSVATNLARTHGLIAVTRGTVKLYPAFEFKGAGVHPRWRDVSAPLVNAGWDGQDILLWMVSPHPALGGREPASLIDTDDADAARDAAEAEATGVW